MLQETSEVSRKDAKAQGEGSGDRGEGSGEMGGGAMNCATTNGAPIVATLEDYAAVRELLIEPLNAGLQGPVSRAVKETVEAVAKLATRYEGLVPVSAVAQKLGVGISSASKRVRRAVDRGYVRRVVQPNQQHMAVCLPEDVLPEPAALASA